MVSVSFRDRIDYRSLSCTRIDRIPLSSESLSRQSTQSTVHTAVPGDLLAMGKILRRTVSYREKYSEDLLARYSGTMHHAKDLLWPRGRRGGGCCCSASQQQYELVQLSATVSRYRAVGPS